MFPNPQFRALILEALDDGFLPSSRQPIAIALERNFASASDGVGERFHREVFCAGSLERIFIGPGEFLTHQLFVVVKFLAALPPIPGDLLQRDGEAVQFLDEPNPLALQRRQLLIRHEIVIARVVGLESIALVAPPTDKNRFYDRRGFRTFIRGFEMVEPIRGRLVDLESMLVHAAGRAFERADVVLITVKRNFRRVYVVTRTGTAEAAFAILRCSGNEITKSRAVGKGK